MATGRVVRFDSTRGYGFIAPESGGEDIFLHVNDLLIPEDCLRPGLTVAFEIADGDRGQRASRIRFPEGAEAPVVPAAGRSAAPSPARSASAGAAQGAASDGDYPVCDVLTSEEFTRDVTELLLKAGPGLTGEQILQLRHELMKFSESHGWVED
jgi:cold shock CspA family protein